MHTKKTKTKIRESQIDEALTESFPASDPPFYVGVGMLQPNDSQGCANDAGGMSNCQTRGPPDKTGS